MDNKIISIDTLRYYNDKISNYVDEKVSDTVDNLELGELNAILVDTDAEADDPIVPDYVTETELNTALSNKMDKVTLAKVATSGSYNDLSNKPTIPTAVTESTVSGWGFTKNTGTYSKPSGGIPKTDLASAVQTSLGKADTALQSYTEQYKGTVTGVKINGTTKNPTSGVVDLGTVITSHQDISGKQDKLVSGTNIKTINGTSILGSGNITISGGSGGSGNGAYAQVNHGMGDTTFTLTPNTFQVWDEVTELNITLDSEISGVASEYLFQFTSGSEPTTLSLPEGIKWANDEAPVIEANKIYQISILKGLGSVLEFSNEVQSVPIVFYVNDTPYDAMSNMTWNDFIHSDYNTNIPNTSDKWFIDKNGYPAYALLYEGELDVYTELVRTSGGVPTLWDKIQDCLYYIAS